MPFGQNGDLVFTSLERAGDARALDVELDEAQRREARDAAHDDAARPARGVAEELGDVVRDDVVHADVPVERKCDRERHVHGEAQGRALGRDGQGREAQQAQVHLVVELDADLLAAVRGEEPARQKATARVAGTVGEGAYAVAGDVEAGAAAKAKKKPAARKRKPAARKKK